jgi:hypothetical protein
MEEKLKQLENRGWGYNLTYDNGRYSFTISRPEWWTNDLGRAIALPSWSGENLNFVIDNAVEYITP